MKRQEVVLSIIVIFFALLGPGASTAAQPTGPALLATSAFTVRVEDQDGLPTANASVVVRDGVSYAVIANSKTNVDGIVTLSLDSARWYVVLVYYSDRGTRETWWYGYILPKDWSPSPHKVMRRNNPWIGTITMPSAPWPIGQEQTVEVTIGHALTTTNYDLKIRVGMWVDDDGQEPYLYETLSDVQSFYNGITPFHVSYTPDAPGHYLVRYRVDRQFEGNDWEVSDEGGWEWSLDVGEAAPTDTPTPTATLTPTMTPVPSATATLAVCVIEGAVYEDLDYDSVLAAQDRSLPGIEVLLTTLSDQPVESQISGLEGRYRFTLSAKGDYRVKLGRVPPGYRHATLAYAKHCEPGMVHQHLDFPLWRWYCRLPALLR